MLLNGVNLNRTREYKVSVDSKVDGSQLAVKFNKEGNSGIDYLSAQWIAWDPKELKAVAKTFATRKLDKNTEHREIVNFDGAFTSKPNFTYGMKGFKVEGMSPLRIGSIVEELTNDHATIKVWTWDNTEVTATFLCIALPST